MEKRKLLSVVLFCLCFAGITLADEVINVDLNGQGDANAYVGEGAIAGEILWRAIYEGTGVAVGSARTANLANYNEPNRTSTYAAQVWLTIPDAVLFDKNYSSSTGNELMDDGFEIDGIIDPCIFIEAEPEDPCYGGGAYNGTYDIYVYCSEATTVTLQSSDINSSDANYTDSVTDTYIGGPLMEPNNYVHFEDVVINSGAAGRGNGTTVTIVWDNVINGITLVKKTTPFQVDHTSNSDARLRMEPSMYDVARESNLRTGGGSSRFGPDLVDVNYIKVPGDGNYIGPLLAYLDNGEYLLFDINCTQEGRYTMDANVVPFDDDTDANMTIYYGNDAVEGEVEVGHLAFTAQAPGFGRKLVATDNQITFNIFEGTGYLKVAFGNGYLYSDLVNLNLWWSSLGLNMPDCAAVQQYHYDYVSDYTGDCRVGTEDLDLVTEHWVECYSPDANDCL
jgi:hypothetical protein